MRYRGAAGATQPDDLSPPVGQEGDMARVDYELLRRLEIKAHGDFPAPGDRPVVSDRPASGGRKATGVGPIDAHEDAEPAGRLGLGKPRNPAVEVVE
ncbi:MAG TPA: hypothetical protein VHI31_06125, partial [Actinomycetota bacterium]|nr:hypothetical protein [Actinomycetota bacterium]